MPLGVLFPAACAVGNFVLSCCLGIWGCLGEGPWVSATKQLVEHALCQPFSPEPTLGCCALLSALVLSCHPSKVGGDHLLSAPSLPGGLKAFQRQCEGSALPCPAAPRRRAGTSCRKRTGRQTRLLTLLKRKVGALGRKEGDCPGMRSRNLQIACCGVAWRIPLPSQGTELFYAVLGVVWGHPLLPQQAVSSLPCVWLMLSLPRTVQGTDP